MGKTTEQRIADELNETPKTVVIGGRKFQVKPLTFGQLLDISAEVSQIKDITKDDEGRDILSVTIEHIDDIERMLNIALIVIFRKPEDRKKNRQFIRENLGGTEYTALQEMYTERLNTAFFLTNIIFLKRELNLTKPTKATAPQQSGTER